MTFASLHPQDTVSFALQDFGGTNANGCLAYLAGAMLYTSIPCRGGSHQLPLNYTTAYMAEDPSVNFMAITNR